MNRGGSDTTDHAAPLANAHALKAASCPEAGAPSEALGSLRTASPTGGSVQRIGQPIRAAWGSVGAHSGSRAGAATRQPGAA